MVKQTMVSSKESPLLQHVIQKLNPTIFAHPIWVRFGYQELTLRLEAAQALRMEAEKLRRQEPSDACQVLLLCAVCQNYAGQKTRALSTLQSVIELAEKAGLEQEILWAKWGACAIRAQQGNFEKAAKYLREIKHLLSQQNDWMLIDFVDVVRLALLHPNDQVASQASDPSASILEENLTTRAVELLDHWGLTTTLAQQDVEMQSNYQERGVSLSLHRLQSRWRSLILMFRGELKLSWGESHIAHEKEQTSLLRSVAGFLHFNILHRNTNVNAVELETHSHLISSSPIELTSTQDSDKELQNSRLFEQQELNGLEPQRSAAPPLSVHMLGTFSMSIQGLALKLPASRSLSLLKYLLLHHNQTTPREVLMDIFWPEAEPEKARNNLNVAMHRIRQFSQPVTKFQMICYQEGLYGTVSNLQIWLDVEEFENHVVTGQRLEGRHQLADAIGEYEAAISLYQGDFLQETPYEEWTILTREHLRAAYLDVLERLSEIYFNQEHYAACITVCQRILAYDQCREDAYCLLMQCYSRQRLDHLALRQYQNCVKALHSELEVEPSPETTKIYNLIRRHELV